MKNTVLEDIKAYAVMRLTTTYGYCGVAESDQLTMLNSDDKAGHDITITIKEAGN